MLDLHTGFYRRFYHMQLRPYSLPKVAKKAVIGVVVSPAVDLAMLLAKMVEQFLAAVQPGKKIR
jgi:hypothetical protein